MGLRRRRSHHDFRRQSERLDRPAGFKFKYEQIMGDAQFVRETIQALNSHAPELDSMYRGEMAAAENRTEIPNVRDIFKEMAEASRECDEMLEIYLWRRRSTV